MPCYGLAENVLFVVGKHDMSTLPTRIRVDVNRLQRDRLLVLVPEPSVSPLPSPSSSSSSSSSLPSPSTASEGIAASRVLVSSGQPLRTDVVSDSGRVVIVDPTTCEEVKDGVIGEIWVCGKSKTLGYWNKSAETQTAFRATLKKIVNPDTERWVKLYALNVPVRCSGWSMVGVGMCRYPEWLRTGDMGCWYEGQLYVTGRIKEMIIINGHRSARRLWLRYHGGGARF